MLPGTAIAALLTSAPVQTFALPLVIGVASACLVASANYSLNEWLDARYDRSHPLNRDRPSVLGAVRSSGVWAQYALLLGLGLALASALSVPFLLSAAALGVMGVLYNVEPIRAKDRVYVDVLSESVNNRIRLPMGWHAVTSPLHPPSSLLLRPERPYRERGLAAYVLFLAALIWVLFIVDVPPRYRLLDSAFLHEPPR